MYKRQLNKYQQECENRAYLKDVRDATIGIMAELQIQSGSHLRFLLGHPDARDNHEAISLLIQEELKETRIDLSEYQRIGEIVKRKLDQKNM